MPIDRGRRLMGEAEGARGSIQYNSMATALFITLAVISKVAVTLIAISRSETTSTEIQDNLE